MRRITPVIITAALSLSLTSCGTTTENGATSGQSSPSTPAPLQTLSLASLSSLSGQKLTEHKNVRVRISGQQAGQKANVAMVMSVASGKPEFDMTIDAPKEDGGRIRILMLNKAVYLETPPGEEPLEPGKPWMMVPNGSKNPMTAAFTLMGNMFSSLTDPNKSLLSAAGEAGAGAGARVTGAKQETVGTVQTMHYTVTIDLDQMVRKLDLRKLMAAMGGMMAGLTPSGTSKKTAAMMGDLDKLSDAQVARLRADMLKSVRGQTMTQDLWVDGQGLPVKQTMNMPTGKGKAEPMELTYSDWGKAPIVAPPADQVATMPDFPSGG